MIKIINNIINDFIVFLNQNYGIEQTVYVHIAENCESIQTPDGGIGFGVFDNTTDKIYVACDYEFMDNRSILTTIAHEYKHFYRNIIMEFITKRMQTSLPQKFMKNL